MHRAYRDGGAILAYDVMKVDDLEAAKTCRHSNDLSQVQVVHAGQLINPSHQQTFSAERESEGEGVGIKETYA